MKRKRYRIIFSSLMILILAGCDVLALKSKIVVVPKDNRPNILLVLVDDLDAKLDSVNYMNNLQQLLVNEGTTIENFLINNPLCCPSRATIFRGQYTHNHAVYHNDAPDGGFEKYYSSGYESSHIGTWLQAAGYRTGLIGKYFNGYPFPDDRIYIPAGWSEWYSPARKNAYDGYDYVLNENGSLIAYSPDEENYFTDVASDIAVDFIKRAVNDDAPFFLYIAPFAPHEPAVAANRHLDLFSDLTIPRTASFNEADVSDKSENMRLNPLISEDMILRLDEKYRRRIRSLQAVDEMLGALYDLLEKTGTLDNTYIVFTSDNGYHLGQHRLVEGKGTFYEEDVVVPFIVRGPDILAGREVSDALFGNVDISVTFADWAGVVPPDFVDGRSMKKILEGQEVGEENCRKAYLLESYPVVDPIMQDTKLPSLFLDFQIDIFKKQPSPLWSALRTNQYLYAEHQSGFKELYDLAEDPFQTNNIASKVPDALLEDLSDWLRQYIKCKGDSCLRIDSGVAP